MKTFFHTQASNQPVTLKLIPRAEYLDLPKCQDPMDEKSRYNFFKLLRGKSKNASNNSEPSQKTYSAATWLSFEKPVTGSVSLLITFSDAYGEQHVWIDKSELNQADSAMLSGYATLDIVGKLDNVKVECIGLPEGTKGRVDDVHFQKKDRKQALKAV